MPAKGIPHMIYWFELLSFEEGDVDEKYCMKVRRERRNGFGYISFIKPTICNPISCDWGFFHRMSNCDLTCGGGGSGRSDSNSSEG